MDYKLDAVCYRLQRLLVQHGDSAMTGSAKEILLSRNLWIHYIEAPLR